LSHVLICLARFLREEEGPTAVEYAIMMALIIIVCIVSITALGTNSNNTFSYTSKQVGKVGS
jgi:pilus assembly protein Flp/PilA